MSELPEGWCETNVGSVSQDISYGFTTSASLIPNGPKFLRITDIQNGLVNWKTVPFCKVPPCDISRFVLKAGDIVFARTGATTGKSFLIRSTPEAVFASYLIRLRPSESILPQLTAYFFQSSNYWQQITENLSGSAQPNCNATKLSLLRIPIPPVNEQRRIIAKLEKLLSRVDSVQVRLATIPRILQRFRQSVLGAACSGRLTTDWREQKNAIEDARVLLSRIKSDPARIVQRRRQSVELDEGDALPEIPTSWVWTTLGESCLKIFDGTHFSPKNSPQGDIKYVTAKNIKEGRLDLSEITFVSKEAHDEIYSRCDVKKGDVLYIKDGATTGIAAVNSLTEQFSLLSSVGVFRTNDRHVLPEYLALFLNSPSTKDRMLKNVAGVAITRLTLAKLVVSSFGLPPFAEQQEIVRRVEALFKTADALEARYRMAKTHVDKLTRSILAKAFRGELVPQDPNDEPASVLLERIRQAHSEKVSGRSSKIATRKV